MVALDRFAAQLFRKRTSFSVRKDRLKSILGDMRHEVPHVSLRPTPRGFRYQEQNFFSCVHTKNRALGRGEERGRENTCFSVEEGMGKPWVSQRALPHVAFVMRKRIFLRCPPRGLRFTSNRFALG